ncbi:hypothetical protein ACFV0O_01785 [Kitasatospora sp. NPDC059577]|uniref:hypothetical protein n=1 Tax=Kitasatospora sp. NPDC059577 TaxID=3346873 RepID=UPI00369D5993
MTDWTELSHAYGSAEDIPALLARIAAELEPGLWSELWSALCHQGSVYSASFAALPWLAGTAESDDREQAVNALCLAGSIVAGAGQSHGADDVRARYSAEIAALSVSANRRLRTAADQVEYVDLLASMLGFEGVEGWGEDLAWGLGAEEFQVSCPGCEAGLFIALGEGGFFCSSEDYALSDEPVESRPLRPARPADLTGLGGRLHGIALGDGRDEVARLLTYVFGDASCPDCGSGFSVADRIGAG